MTEPELIILAETERFSVWQVEDPEGETMYNIELGGVTVHLFREEWEEFLMLVGEIGDR